MRERALQVGPYARHVSQVLRFAVARVEAGENTQDLAGALRRKRDVALDESGGVESGIALSPCPHVAAEERQLRFFRHVNARVLQERGNVISRRPHQGILEIENADPLELFALRQPKEV